MHVKCGNKYVRCVTYEVCKFRCSSIYRLFLHAAIDNRYENNLCGEHSLLRNNSYIMPVSYKSICILYYLCHNTCLVSLFDYFLFIYSLNLLAFEREGFYLT